MSSGFSIKVTKDAISPDLRRRIALAKNPQPLLLAMGAGLVQLTKRAFHDASVRALPWPPRLSDGNDITYDARGKRHNALGKVSGKPLLIGTHQLEKSPRIISVTDNHVIIGAARETPKGGWNLAAIHQLGAPRRNIRPRPFFPFTPTGEATTLARTEIQNILTTKLDKMLT